MIFNNFLNSKLKLHSKEILINLISLPRYSKQTIVIIVDLFLCILCTWFAFCLRLDELISIYEFNFYTALISAVIAIHVYWLFGLYRNVHRYTGLSIILNLIAPTAVYISSYFLIIGVYVIEGVPRSIGILQPILLFLFIICSRLIIKFLLNISYNSKEYSSKKGTNLWSWGIR